MSTIVRRNRQIGVEVSLYHEPNEDTSSDGRPTANTETASAMPPGAWPSNGSPPRGSGVRNAGDFSPQKKAPSDQTCSARS